MSFPHAFPFGPVVTCTLLMPAPKQCLQMFDTCPCHPELLCNLCNSISGLNQPAGGHRLGDCKNMLPRKPENPQNVTLPDEKSSVVIQILSLDLIWFQWLFFFHFDSLRRKKKSNFIFILIFKTMSQIVHRICVMIQERLLAELEADLPSPDLLEQCFNLSTDN